MTLPSRQFASTHFPMTYLALATIFFIATPIVAQTTSWNGTMSTDWRTSGNWSQGIPGSATSTTVSNGSSTGDFDLIVPGPTGGDTARVGGLMIQNGGTMAFAQSPTPGLLLVHGSVFSLNGGTVSLNDGKIVFTESVQFNNGGSFNAGTGTLEFQGDIVAHSGSGFLPDSSTVIFNGSGDQTISGDLEFYNLVVETEGSLFLSGDVNVQGTVTIESGSTLHVESGASFLYEGTIQGEGEFIVEGLPVQLTTLSAASSGPDVVLRWSTSTETDNFGFEVERRSIRGPMTVGSRQTEANGWSKIGFVQGAGTSSAARKYSYVDGNVPTGRHAYRLVQVDFDGSSHTSFETEIDILAPREFGIGANYPNPFNPQTTLDYSVATDALVRISVYDIQGREVTVLVSGFVLAGNYKVQWNATALSSGVYHAVMEFENRRFTKSMLLVK